MPLPQDSDAQSIVYTLLYLDFRLHRDHISRSPNCFNPPLSNTSR